MTTFQKVIKYCAIGLAAFLCVLIISAAVNGIRSFTEIFNFAKNKNKTKDNDEAKYSEVIDFNDQIIGLNLDLKGTNLIIEEGSKLSVEVDDKDIRVFEENNTLRVVDKNNKVIKSASNVTITMPSYLYFERVNITTGAGKVKVNGINTNELNMELGAGKVTLSNINSAKTSIETGAGSVLIKKSILNDLDLELGVGEINIDADITGNSNIESGIGSLKLDLNNNESMYKFDIEKGIGSITFNGDKITNNTIIGNGENHIKIEGGIGSIKIKTSD